MNPSTSFDSAQDRPLRTGSKDPLQLNEHGELHKCGPTWSCEQFGTTGHDYYTCPDCLGNYQTWLSRIYKPQQVSI